MVRAIYQQSIAFARKDLEITFRFKVSALTTIFVPALINFGLFGTVFFGFLRFGSQNTSGVNVENFVAFTMMGALFTTLFNQGQGAFSTRFANEKYWQTTPVILASPLSRWAILLGTAVSELLKFAVVASVFLTAALIAFPTSMPAVAFTLVLLVVLYVMVSGVSLIRGALFLIDENLDPVINYFLLGTAYLSCFYYPASFIPSFLQWIAYINPVYFVVSLARNTWFGSPVNLAYVVASLGVTLLSISVGILAFNRIWRNYDVTGY